jgi:DNA-binding NarL/FixJ family response regulator
VSEPIRILLADMPRTLEELVSEAVSTQPDMEVVGTVSDGESLLAATRRARAQLVVVAASEDAVEQRYRRVVLQQPNVRVLALSEDGRETTLYEVRPHRVALGELSPGQLADAIRAALRRDSA